MFCPKCHTEIINNDKTCPRCGYNIAENKSNKKYNQFSKSRSFERMNVKNIINNTHQDQYDYSKKYSDVINDVVDTHEEQYEYNKKYSKITKDNNELHEKQFEYNKKYSNINNMDTKQHKDQYNYSQSYSNNVDSIGEDDLIKAYINNRNFNYNAKTLSIQGLIFGPFYLLYKKMWLHAILFFIIYILLISILNEELIFVSTLIVNIIIAVKFHELYLKEARRNVQSILNNQHDKTSQEIRLMCINAGQPLETKTMAIITFIILTIINIIIISK